MRQKDGHRLGSAEHEGGPTNKMSGDDMSSICRFIPSKPKSEGLETVYFVYETELHKLRQPFCHSTYYMYLAVRGNGQLHLGGKTFPLRRGALFIISPHVRFTIDGDPDFTYMYISFMGERAHRLTEGYVTDENTSVFYGFEWLIEFWQSCIRRVTRANANVLSESVVLYTLSFLSAGQDGTTVPDRSRTLYESMLAYVESHFTDADISLRKLADIFSYTEKYLSHLFKKNTGVNFNAYLTQMRIDYAVKCIEGGMRSISEIAELCGYYDALYFSKVFKRVKGDTPLAFMKKSEEAPASQAIE